ncbi:MAG: YnbE family lipoprotein [Alphaproteobacteria bacterium]|nr:YnbE family lipoprotein [Alphaproteobacteria bacterium]
MKRFLTQLNLAFLIKIICLSLISALLSGCSPTVKVEAPDKPIVINLNVKIEQEIRVKIDKDVDNLLKNNPDLF